MSSATLVIDFIELAWRQFNNKYQDKEDDVDDLMNTLDTMEYDEKYLSPTHIRNIEVAGEGRKRILDSISQELLDKDFSREFVNKYIEGLEKTNPEDMVNRIIQDDILSHFTYNNQKMKLKDLHSKILPENLTTINLDIQSRKAIQSQLEFYIEQDTMYNDGLKSLLQEVEQITTEQTYTKISRKMSSVTHIDPSNKEHRKEIYMFYEDLHPLYDLMKNNIKEVLTLWDRVEEILIEETDKEGNKTGKQHTEYTTSDGDAYIEELDKELNELKELHNMMKDDLNYIKKFDLIPYNIVTSRDRNVSQNVEGLIVEKIAQIFGKTSAKYIKEIEDEEEEFPDYDAGIWEGEGSEDKPEPQPDTVFEEKDEEEEDKNKYLAELGEMQTRIKVDPMFIIASEEGLLKRKYTIHSWTKTKQEIEERLKDAQQNNPGAIGIYADLLEEHENYQEQAFDEDDNMESFYLPLTSSVVTHLDKYADFKVNYDEIERFHERLVKVILDILEEPTDRSTTPYHVEPDDFTSGGEKLPSIKENPMKRERMLTTQNLFSRLQPGKKGKKREPAVLGKFQESLMELINTADRYYGDPIRELMLPYKTIPSFLSSDTLSSLINHGPEHITQITLGLYREYFIGFITPRQLNKLTDYLVESNKARKDVTNLEKSANGVLDVLESLVPNNQEKDINWFANEFKQNAKRDSSFNIQGIRLQNRRIRDLSYDRSRDKTVYHTILLIIYKFKHSMLKNPYTKEAMTDFISAYEEQSSSKLASEMQTKILNTHDEIRKMMGKPIYYNTCRLDSFEHVNDTIDIIKSDYKVELTGTDIVGIVNEYGSMETLGKKYGTNSDVIYHIKALYR
tara:strand:+ start:4195 stop:6738 length:2544 start_codon:yes stop_codon:yes gene_type:complete